MVGRNEYDWLIFSGRFTREAFSKFGFLVNAKITHCHTFTKEIKHASIARSPYVYENFYFKNCLRLFSAMTGMPA